MDWVGAHCDSSNPKLSSTSSPSVRPTGFFMSKDSAPEESDRQGAYPGAVFGTKGCVRKYFALGNTFPKSEPTIERRKSEYCGELLSFLLTFFSRMTLGQIR